MLRGEGGGDGVTCDTLVPHPGEKEAILFNILYIAHTRYVNNTLHLVQKYARIFVG